MNLYEITLQRNLSGEGVVFRLHRHTPLAEEFVGRDSAEMIRIPPRIQLDSMKRAPTMLPDVAWKPNEASIVENADWEPWSLFFLRALKSQVGRLRERLDKPDISAAGTSIPDELSPLACRLLELLKSSGTLSVREAAEALAANRDTLKDKFSELIDNGYAELRGKGRGAHYRAANQ